MNINPLLGLSVLEKQLKQNKQLRPVVSKQAKEEAMKQKSVLRLTAYLAAAALPSVSRIQAMDDPAAAWLRAFGSRRGSTLKNRALAWEPFFRWIEQAEGRTWPSGAGSILQYLQERFDGGTLRKTTPSSFLAWSRWAKLPDAAVKSWTSELEVGAKPVRKAPLFTVAILLALEMTLVRLTVENGLRFMVLIMIWSALRCDDLKYRPCLGYPFTIGVEVQHLARKDVWSREKAGHAAGFRAARHQFERLRLAGSWHVIIAD